MLGRGRQSLNIWPGFVDGLASVLLVFLFMLMIFVVAQFFLSGLINNREGALAQLSNNVHELLDELSVEQSRVSELEVELEKAATSLRGALNRAEDAEREAEARRTRAADLDRQLTLALQRASAAEASSSDASEARAALEARLADLETRSTDARTALERRLAEVEARERATAASNASLGAELDAVRQELAVSREELRLQLTEVAGLQQDVDALRKVRAELEAAVGDLEATLVSRDDSMTALRDTSKGLEASLASLEDRTRLNQIDLEARDRRIWELAAQVAEYDRALEEERTLTLDERARIVDLQQQLNDLNDEITRLSSALQIAESEVAEYRTENDTLTERLNVGLIRRVEELERYRSEFFGRLVEVLGERDDVRVIGDRFTFQSELLFPSGAAELEPAGREQLARLAATLKEVSAQIPADVDWLLRVDGHTDRVPTSPTSGYASNWALSSARALSVVNFLVDEGIPAERLAAAGFGEFHPLDAGSSAQALARNRRIEIKLTRR